MPIFSKLDPAKVPSVSIPVSAPAPIPVPIQVAVPVPAPIPPTESPEIVVKASNPDVPAAPARKPVGRSSYATPSILDALNDLSKESELGIIADSTATSYGEKQTAKPFELAELLVAWLTFVGTVEAPQLKSALSAREPQIIGEWEILYELDTELQYNRLTLDLKPKLLGFLRRQLENQAIEITFQVSDDLSPISDIPYTDEEKWNVLVSKYPSLALLKSKFGLDFEHY